MKFILEKSRETSHNDREMLTEFRRSGDLEVLGRLYANYMTLIYGLCLKYLKNEDQSKDAVMQIFEQLIAKLKLYEVDNFKSWLYTLARNYCLMELRSACRHEFVTIDEYAVESSSFLHQEYDDFKEGQLRNMEDCIVKLPEEQRITVDLFYIQQKCYREISEITGFELSKVKSYIQNGKRNLKICMEKKSGNE